MSQGEYHAQVEQALQRQEEEAQRDCERLEAHRKWLKEFWRNTPSGFGLTKPKIYDNETKEIQ